MFTGSVWKLNQSPSVQSCWPTTVTCSWGRPRWARSSRLRKSRPSSRKLWVWVFIWSLHKPRGHLWNWQFTNSTSIWIWEIIYAEFNLQLKHLQTELNSVCGSKECFVDNSMYSVHKKLKEDFQKSRKNLRHLRQANKPPLTFNVGVSDHLCTLCSCWFWSTSRTRTCSCATTKPTWPVDSSWTSLQTAR